MYAQIELGVLLDALQQDDLFSILYIIRGTYAQIHLPHPLAALILHLPRRRTCARALCTLSVRTIDFLGNGRLMHEQLRGDTAHSIIRSLRTDFASFESNSVTY